MMYNNAMDGKKRRAAFYTLGCRTNQYESAKLAEEFARAGYEIVAEDEAADVYVVNTCTVTSLADRKSRQYIRRMKRQNPDAFMIVAGCYPQISRKEVEAIEEADLVLGTFDKMTALEAAQAHFAADSGGSCASSPYAGGSRASAADAGGSCASAAVAAPSGRTRGLIQIQTGCDRFCAYCVIPYARGPVKSKPLGEIVREAEALVENGCREIVLTGINTARYDGGVEPVLAELNAIPGDFRIRFGSLEPTVVDAAYVERLLRYDKLCRHFHLSLQSGSARVLSAMDRRYSPAEYMDIVRTVRDFDPLFGLTTDIIAGFPGETEEDFSESLRLIGECSFLHVHAFPYSRRPLTKAASMAGQIAPSVKKERTKRLIEAGEAASEAFRRRMTGTVQRVLIEEEKDGWYTGHASDYCNVYLPSGGGDDIINMFVNVRVSGLFADGVTGRKE